MGVTDRTTTKDQKTESTEKPLDFRAINPRYQGAMASDLVRALVKPKTRDKLAKRWEKKELGR